MSPVGATATTTVLIVDDEQGLVDLYAAYLADEYETRRAFDGTQALEAIDGGVDVVLLDRRMPGLPGDDVLAELRDRGHDQPIAMLTAVDPGADILELAVDDYITKPVDQATIRETVAALATRARYDEETRNYFAILSKKAAVEATMTDQNLAASATYQRLRRAIDAAKAEIDPALNDPRETDALVGFREYDV